MILQIGRKVKNVNPKVGNEYIRQIPKVREVSLTAIHNDPAIEYHADNTRHVSSVIFLIVSEAPYEEFEKAKAINKNHSFPADVN